MESEEPESAGGRRFRLTGERFKGGRLPIDSLQELENYQAVMRLVATAQWEADHPDADPSEDPALGVSLVIDDIKPTSADVYLVFEQHMMYAEYREAAQDLVDETIAAAYSDAPLPALPAAVAHDVQETLARLGSTLRHEQTIEVYVDGDDSPPVVVSVESRPKAMERLQLDSFWADEVAAPNLSRLVKLPETIVGRVTVLDADNHRFVLQSVRYGELRASYKDKPQLLEDLREYVNLADDGPVTRIVGELQYRDGKPWRITSTEEVQRFAVDSAPWGNVLLSIAALNDGWGPETGGRPVSFASLEGADAFLRGVAASGVALPGIFPDEGGTVLLEWSSPESVRSVEVLADGTFELFSLPAGSFDGVLSVTADVKVAVRFAVEGSAR
jgi:hypothetical protein